MCRCLTLSFCLHLSHTMTMPTHVDLKMGADSLVKVLLLGGVSFIVRGAVKGPRAEPARVGLFMGAVKGALSGV